MVSRCDNSALDSDGFARVRNQDSENFISVELLQKLHVVLKEQTQIVHAVTQHGQTLHAHAEGEADVFFAVDADMLKHVRMHHAATADLQPAVLPAHIHLGGRLGEREERGTETHLHVFGLEIVLQEICDHTFEIGETHALADPQAFDLMEHRRVRRIGVHAVNAPRRDDADVGHAVQMRIFRHVRLHVANLDRRSVRAQHVLLVDVERVVHGTRRMVFRDIQRGEIVEIVFDLGTFRYGVTDGMEKAFNALQRARDRMQSAHADAAPRQRHVERLRRQLEN
nr:phenylalanyl-tRNA synthetase subunit alpha [uncultured bacterium]